MEIGDTLYCKDGSTVVLEYFDSEIIVVEYRGKRYRRPYSAIGRTLFPKPAANFDEYGYDRDGYDQDGYDRDGYNRDGYNRDGYE